MLTSIIMIIIIIRNTSVQWPMGNSAEMIFKKNHMRRKHIVWYWFNLKLSIELGTEFDS